MIAINANTNIRKIRKLILFAIIFLIFTFVPTFTGTLFINPLHINSITFTVLAQDVQENEQQAQKLSERSNRIHIANMEEDVSQTQSCLEQGKELFFEQKYSEAVKQLEQCQSLDPENPEIYYYIGQSYFQLGQSSAQKMNVFSATKYFKQAYEVSDTAIEKYLKTIDENPDKDHTNDYLRLAYIYQIRSLIPGVDEFQEAINIYQKLLEEKPSLTNAHYHMGWIYYQQKDYQNAIDSFIAYLESGIKSDFVYYHLGQSYDKIGERQNAEHYFQLVLEEFPGSDVAGLAKKELQQKQN